MAILKKKSLEEDHIAEVEVGDAHLRVDGGEATESAQLERKALNGSDWRRCLAEAIANMPPDMAQKLLQIVPKDVLAEVLKSVEHPVVKLALMLLAR
ncbi:MAG: hypothetical protein ABWK05_08405 [Pyrobaculum sp.]